MLLWLIGIQGSMQHGLRQVYRYWKDTDMQACSLKGSSSFSRFSNPARRQTVCLGWSGFHVLCGGLLFGLGWVAVRFQWFETSPLAGCAYTCFWKHFKHSVLLAIATVTAMIDCTCWVSQAACNYCPQELKTKLQTMFQFMYKKKSKHKLNP